MSQDFFPDYVPGQRVGDYELLEFVGSGSTGAVFRARSEATGAEVALKIVQRRSPKRRDELARLRREAEIQSRLDHPCIAKLHQMEDSGDPIFFVMEFVPGQSLAELIDQRTHGPGDFLKIVEQVVDGLEGAWEAGGVVHRDVKPSNIRITPDGRVKLVDFGLARSTADELATTLTGTGVILGTPSYMSPEQALGRPADFRSDLYSLGVVLYQGITGRLPFVGRNPVEVILKHREEVPPVPSLLLPGMPSILCGTLRRLLQKEPEDRFSSFEQLREALRECQAIIDSSPKEWSIPRPASLDSRASKATVLLPSTRIRGAVMRSRRALGWAFSALVLGLSSLGTWAFTGGGEQVVDSHPSATTPAVVQSPLPTTGIPSAEEKNSWTAPSKSNSVDASRSSATAMRPASGRALRPPCGFELRGVPCPFEQPWSPEVGKARARTMRGSPWKVLPVIFDETSKLLSPMDETARKEVKLLEFDQEMRARVNAFAYVELVTSLTPKGLAVLAELSRACAELGTSMRADPKQATRILLTLKARADSLPKNERELLDEVMIYGNVPDSLQTGPGLRNRSRFVPPVIGTLPNQTDPGQFNITITRAR